MMIFKGGIVNVIAGQPLDTVKVKMQTFPTFYPEGIRCFGSILRLDGIRGLYAGLLFLNLLKKKIEKMVN